MTDFITLLRKTITNLDRYQIFLSAAWVVVMLSLPIVARVFGQQALLQGLALSVLLQAGLVLNVLNRSWGWWSMLKTSLGVVLLSWAVLAIVIRSGLPYGNLHYTSSLQPQVLNVPVLIPLTWLMMLPTAWAVAKLITRTMNGCLLRLVFVLVSALAFTAWCFYFDPLMVHLGVLNWTPAGAFYGTPWLHSLGLGLVSGLITFGISPKRLPGGLLVMVYMLTWLLEFISLLIFWGLPVPALVGFFLMGGTVIWAGMVTR
jgi:uncharacterized membrane protein